MKLVKKLFNLIQVSFVWLIICSFIIIEAQENNGLVGEWVELINDNEFTFYFMEENRLEIVINSNDGESYITHKGNYFIDNKKLPNTIDLRNISNYTGPLFGILKIIDSNTIQISKFSNKWRLRPLSFDKNTTLIFHRKTTKGNIKWSP
jgi:hypothetical protein